jgi:hypothetical protein
VGDGVTAAERDPAYGRLDRILSEQAASSRAGAARVTTTLGGGAVLVEPDRECSEVRRLRSMVAALEAECAALADALGARTHEFAPGTPGEPRWCAAEDGDCLLAGGLTADHPVHRTPAVVRAELEGQ